MKHFRLMFFIVVSAALIACQPVATSTPQSSAGTAATDWQPFTSKEGGFTLLLPGTPKQQRRPVSTSGGSVEATMYMAEVNAVAYGVGYSDFPGDPAKSDPQKVLAGARDAAAQNTGGTLSSAQAIELNGHPGLEIAIEMPKGSAAPEGGVYRARLYLVGNRMYQIIYVALKQDDDQAAYRKLFDSFQLDNTSTPIAAAPSTSINNWIEYRSDKGGFSILLPQQPQEQTQPLDTAGGTAQLNLALVKYGDFTLGVSYNDIPAEALKSGDANTLLQGGRDGTAQNLKGKVVSDKAINLGAYPGIEFVVEAPDSVRYQARVYVVDNRLYQIMFIAPQNKADQIDTAAFFDSFKLLNK